MFTYILTFGDIGLWPISIAHLWTSNPSIAEFNESTIGDSASLVLTLWPASGDNGDSFPTIMEVNISTCLLSKFTTPKQKRERWEGSLAQRSAPTPSSKSVKITTLISGRVPPVRLPTNALPVVCDCWSRLFELTHFLKGSSNGKVMIGTMAKQAIHHRWVTGCVRWRLSPLSASLECSECSFVSIPTLNPTNENLNNLECPNHKCD